MTFKMVLADAKQFQHIISSWSLLDEANVFASEKGLELRAMDPSRVAMLDFTLPVVAFEDYEFNSKNPLRLGLNVAELKTILARLQTNDILSIELNNSTKLELTFSGAIEKKFGLALLDLGEGQYPAPNQKIDAMIKLSTSEFTQILKDAEVCGGHILFHATKESLTLATSTETKDFKITIEKDSDLVADFKVTQEVKANYNLSYLKEMTHEKLSPLVQISFSSAMPVCFEYRIMNSGRQRYFLSPRIEI